MSCCRLFKNLSWFFLLPPSIAYRLTALCLSLPLPAYASAQAQQSYHPIECHNQAVFNFDEAWHSNAYALCPVLLELFPQSQSISLQPARQGYNSLGSWKICVDATQTYHAKVLRQSGNAAQNPSHEVAFARWGAQMHLAPDVFLPAKAPYLLLSHYVAGQTLPPELPVDDPRCRATLLLLRSMHLMGTSARHILVDTQNLRREDIQHVQAAWDAAYARDPNDMDNITQLFLHLQSYARFLLHRLSPMGFTPSICHGDLSLGNILWDEKRIWLIDWGSAGYADPMVDVADFAFNQSTPIEMMRTWAKVYGAEPKDTHRLELRLAWMHLQRYYAAVVGMPWDKPERRDAQLGALRRLIAHDQAFLGYVTG